MYLYIIFSFTLSAIILLLLYLIFKNIDIKKQIQYNNIDIKKYENDYVTIFFAGNGSSIAQATKYTDSQILGMTSKNRINVLVNPYLNGNVDPFDVKREGIIPYLVYPFYYSNYVLFKCIYNLKAYITNPFKINLAQKDDIDHHVNIVKRCISDNLDKKIIFYGCSRGAALALSVLAELDNDTRRKIKMVILEGVFDTVEKVINYRSN